MTAQACGVKASHAAEREDSSSTGGGDGPHVGRSSSRERRGFVPPGEWRFSSRHNFCPRRAWSSEA